MNEWISTLNSYYNINLQGEINQIQYQSKMTWQVITDVYIKRKQV